MNSRLVGLLCLSLQRNSALAAECSSSCAKEFIGKCIPHKRGQGESTSVAYESCLSELKGGTGPIAAHCKDTACNPTPAMLLCKTTDCGASSPGPAPGPATGSGTSAGSSVVSEYGRVVIVGDSACDGRGTTQGNIEKALSEALSNTIVENYCKGGSNVAGAYSQIACSSKADCKWAVLITGMNGEGGKTVQDIVDREINAGKKVIIQGHPKPMKDKLDDRWAAFMEEYKKIATSNDKVWFIDTRVDPDFPPTATTIDWKWYANDKSHPSPLSGTKFGKDIAAIIKANAGSAGPAPGPAPGPGSVDNTGIQTSGARSIAIFTAFIIALCV